MSYSISFTKKADEDVRFLRQSGDKRALKKLQLLLEELVEHPETGTGHPEKLRYRFSGLWSRKITEKHRLVYRIEESTVIVVVLSAKDHYQDK